MSGSAKYGRKPESISGFEPMLIVAAAKLLQLLHWYSIPIHDCDEVSEIWFRDPLRLDMQETTLDARYAGDALCPLEE